MLKFLPPCGPLHDGVHLNHEPKCTLSSAAFARAFYPSSEKGDQVVPEALELVFFYWHSLVSL